MLRKGPIECIKKPIDGDCETFDEKSAKADLVPKYNQQNRENGQCPWQHDAGRLQ